MLRLATDPHTCLAVRTDPARVYRQALNYFTGAELAEAFTATRGVASPTQLRASGPGLNSTIHIIGSAAVLLVLLVPALERRMTAWLSGGGRAPEAVARP
jgi:hypothetical protein